MPDKECCDYCGEVVFIGDKYYTHMGLHICSGCARSYAWAVFEEESTIRELQFDQLLDMQLKEQ